jgi:hypothetical protein
MKSGALALALLCAAPALAQTPPLPETFVSQQDLERFRVCRAAVFYHLDGPPDPDSTVPQALARALLGQINFIIAETIFAKPHGPMQEGEALLRFTESWFLGFSRTIAGRREALSDVATRDRVLIECVPLVWSVARFYIDGLAAWRSAADPTPPVMTPESAREKRESIERDLGLRE